MEQQEPPAAPAPAAAAPPVTAPRVPSPPAPEPAKAAAAPDFAGVHAGPNVRRLARELGVDLKSIDGTGPKGRISKEDLPAKLRGAGRRSGRRDAIREIPAQDVSTFGRVETQPLPRIKKVSGPFLHQSWLNMPHGTHNDEADITEIDACPSELNTAAKAEGYRVTVLAFLMKAAASSLEQFTEFKSSLSAEKDGLILKRYYNIGIAGRHARGPGPAGDPRRTARASSRCPRSWARSPRRPMTAR